MASSARRTGWLHSGDPEIDQKNQHKRGQNQPRKHHDLDSQFANGRDVVVDVWVAIEEAVAISKGVRASNQIDDEEERCCYSKRRKNGGID